MKLDKTYLERYKSFYKNQLLKDTIPFWFPKSIEEGHGGFLLMRDRDGSFHSKRINNRIFVFNSIDEIIQFNF